MLDRALQLLKDYGQIVEDQAKYLKDTSWTSIPKRKTRVNEYALHKKLVAQFLDKLKMIVMEAGDDFHKTKTLVSFSKKIAKQIEMHISRCHLYFKTERWQDYDMEDSIAKSDEIEFQNSIVSDVVKFKEELAKLNLNEENKSEVTIDIFGKDVLPLIYRERVEKRHPKVKEHLDKLGEKHKNGK